MKKSRWSVCGLLLWLVCVPASLLASELDDLARDFWDWRAVTQPVSADDIPRIERPAGWAPDWSQAAADRERQELDRFEARWRAFDPLLWPVPKQVDYRLLGSAMARVRWELDVLRSWRRNPGFYVDQTVGAVALALLPPPPFDHARAQDVIARLNAIPNLADEGKANLTDARAPFTKLAIDDLADIKPRLQKVERELKPLLPAEDREAFSAAMGRAITALEGFRSWLQQKMPRMQKETAVGREAYMFFLRQVALLTYTPDQLLGMGRTEWARAVDFEVLERQRNQGQPELPLFASLAEQVAATERDEAAIRKFLEDKNLLTVPVSVQHYTMAPMPGYLEPLDGATEMVEHTSPARLNQNGTRYLLPPSDNLGYFWRVAAHNPRPEIVHEGTPGHYFQLAMDWASPNLIRRHYYDSSANEGLGFYAEEMMLQAGLFDDRPRIREIIYNFMRLRALRVEVDVKLALGMFSLDDAADYLARTVPMDPKTARDEASMFASTPGQAISYQVGKLQIMEFLADAHRAQGKRFSLRAFDDFLWQNGNVPIALQRWEYLGLRDEVPPLENRKALGPSASAEKPR